MKLLTKNPFKITLIAILGIAILFGIRHLCFEYTWIRWDGLIKYAILSIPLGIFLKEATKSHVANFAVLQLCNYVVSGFYFGFDYINSYLGEHYPTVVSVGFVQYLIIFIISKWLETRPKPSTAGEQKKDTAM